MKRKRLFTVSLLVISYLPVIMSQTLRNGRFSYDNVYLDIIAPKYQLYSTYAWTDDLLDQYIWSEGHIELKDSVLICKTLKDSICLKFKIINTNRLKLIRSKPNLINKRLLYASDLSIDSVMSKFARININQCYDSVFFRRTLIYDTEGKLWDELLWDNDNIIDLGSSNKTQNSLLKTLKMK